MGRLEALVVAALGRSPYEEQLVSPQNIPERSGIVGTGQQYDERGHPVNFETRQRIRDHVRASNEVMHTAGIIEEAAAVMARDKAVEETLNQEREMGLRRLEVGRVLLVGGVWGVCGLRRRILLYKSYSGGLFDVLRRERAQYSIPHILGAGLPALGMYQCIEWLGLRDRDAASGLYGESLNTEPPFGGRAKFVLRYMLYIVIEHFMLHCQTFAILQQLNLLSSDKLFPSFRFFIPFSAKSPLQMPPRPASFTLLSLVSWSTAFFAAVAPMGLILLHTGATSLVSSIISIPLYRLLPRPVNLRERLFAEIAQTLNEIEDSLTAAMPSDPQDPDSPSMPNWDHSLSGSPDAPTEHAATLQALEGRLLPPPPPPPQRDDSSDEEDHEMSPQALITFDVEATEISEASMVTWSAELRNANEPPPKGAAYQITTLTILPPFLAARGLSAVLAGIVLLPLEAVMVRALARSFRQNTGLGTGDLYAVGVIPWQAMWNLLVVPDMELAVTVAIWGIFTVGSQVTAGKYALWGREDDGDEDEEE